jgi:hypothetical protein
MLAFTLIGLFMGCTGGLFKNYGSFKPSTIATENFEKLIVNNDYNYFLSGSDVYPVAIFGLKKDYTIDSDENLWKKIDQKPEVISDLVSHMQTRLRDCCRQSPHGFDILDNNGNKIGEWYSMLDLIIAIKIKEDKKVVIYPPSDTDNVKRYKDMGQ